ncbi:kinesin-like protein Klp8 [Rhizopus azygosporus]|uniref:Kinesin-like protein Klp8 n=1 Tax=Rhizopus azygosporus TaxID=86630 RepID=A0A367JTT0_RHIAZ|nr:kinesin-like protein Klp8 [Rhizopus azygosporus]
MSGNIKVVVRCRPLNEREKARGAENLVRMEGNQTIITKKNGKENIVKAFTFDRSYWSVDKDDPDYADQALVYNDLGKELLDHAFDGYNCCIFAYGQTGSGKSYTMMGYGEDKGIIPRTCEELFERIDDLSTPELSYQVEVSYIEIYNEKVRDLLNPANKGNLKVREHPTIGPYVEDLSRLVARTVAYTNMNATSSRSHAVFTLFLSTTRQGKTEKSARISLVDLAGSERATSTGATGVRLKEGANINKSLTTLGKVIASLAEHHHKKNEHIPYRDSVLTWLLKDSLGGNSKTAMVAAISPADYDETLSTLRYADQAKRIKNKAVVNEDPNTRLIRELKQELQALKDTLMIYAPEEVERIVQQKKSGQKITNSSRSSSARASPMLLISPESPIVTRQGTRLMTTEQVLEQLEASEKLLEQVNQTWEEKMTKTETIHREREKALEELGVIVEKNNMGVYAPKSIHLINLSEDPLITECLMYHIKPGTTHVGRLGSDAPADIRLSGEEIMEDHCHFENVKQNESDEMTTVTIYPRPHSVTLVNGMRIQEPKVLHNGYRIIFGSGLHHLFRFNHPEEAKRMREKQQQQDVDEELPADWKFAHSEALSKFVNPSTDINAMTDDDIQQLYVGISKVHEFRSRKRISSSDGGILDDDSVTSTSNLSRRTSVRFSQVSSTTSLTTERSEEQQRQDELEVKYLQVKQEMETVLEQQKREYENKIKRISAHLPPGTTLSSDDLLIGYTSKNASEYLVKKTLAHWRQWRYVKMAEGCLVHAVVLKEANIMAKELGKNVTYQFTVVHDNMSASPVSFWEASSALQPFEREVDDALMEEPKPCLAVQVIDHMHRVAYIWSIANIKNRLRSMRQLYDYTDRPLFSHPHFFHRDDPFYETPCPRYSLIGFARVPLRNLTLQLHADNLVDIYCRNTGKVMGQLRVLVTPIARSISRRSFKQAQERSLSVVSEKYLLHIGQQQVFEIRIQEVIGISESDFTQVHAQFHLSSFGNVEPNSREDKVYPTEPVSQFGDSPVKFDHCQTLSIHITEKMMGVILDEGLTIEVFGQAQEDYLYQLVDMPPQTGAMTDIPVSRRFSLDRRFSLEKSTYDGILMEERHDVLAWIQIAELDSEGNYAPVPVTHDPMEAFSLRQGIQRRISLTLVHDSGNQFQWKNISCLKIGQVRLVDQQGRLLETTSAEPVEIQLFPQTGAELDKSGISRMMAQGPWDSSLHNSIFLNRTTPSHQYVQLTLSWQVNCDKCVSPLQFELDFAVQIQGRDMGIFRQLWSPAPAKQVYKASAKYVVHLKPQMTRQVRELWRLNTANKYVRGEEFIGSWKPRGVSLITEYREARRKMEYREHVAAFRHALLLAGHPQAKEIRRGQLGIEEEKKEEKVMDSKELLEKVIQLWTRKFGTQEEIIFNQDPPSVGSMTPSTSSQSIRHSSSNQSINEYHQKNVKLIADIQQLYPSDTVTKKGYLLHPRNVDEEWQKYWFVLRRPYIIIYQDNTETEELGVLHLTSARVDYKSEIEKMLQRKNMFAIYTSNNAYLLEALDFDDMKDWISKIDQFYPVDNLQ